MPFQGWLSFGILAWITGYCYTRWNSSENCFDVPVGLYIVCGLPKGFTEIVATVEGLRLQILGLLLIVLGFIHNRFTLNDAYLILSALAIATLISFFMKLRK